MKKIFLLSAGLGNISRGFEVSALTWFEALDTEQELDVFLFSGGKNKKANKVWNIARNSNTAKMMRSFHLLKDGCRLEQISFSLGLLPYLFKNKPDVIWVQEINLANMLYRLRKWLGFKFKIVFCDGAPVGYECIKKFDYLIFLQKHGFNEALRRNCPLNKAALIPHITSVPQRFTKSTAREIYKFDQDKFIIICVAAWNKHHKRIDYLLNEIALLEDKNLLLLLCGQPEEESQELKDLAKKLNIDAHWFTLSQEDLAIAYDASDLFILPSLDEGLGAVIIEAGMHNLPIVAHPHKGSKFILGENYPGVTDLSKKGNLAIQITKLRSQTDLIQLGKKTGLIVAKGFTSKELVDRFLDFIKPAFK